MVYLILLWDGLFIQSSGTSLDSDVISYEQLQTAVQATAVRGCVWCNGKL